MLCCHFRGKAGSVFGIVAGFAAISWAERACAHATEGGFVLLLPTGIWVAAGTASVALTVVLVALVPPSAAMLVFRRFGATRRPLALASATRATALVLLAAAIWHGLSGTPDPAKNAMPLLVWPVFWMALVAIQALAFDVWRFVNPFAPLVRFKGIASYPKWLGQWPAVFLFLTFTAFLLADPESTDPRRLARLALAYIALTAVMGAFFGARWLARAEVFTVIMRTYARIAPVYGGRAGLWGWRAARGHLPSIALAVFMATLLAGGSFDGLNETFLWMGAIGVNPLEFPGRSAIIAPTIAGLLGLTAALLAIYTTALAAGLALARHPEPLSHAFRRFAPSLLPIAAAYHMAHYLVAFLIDIQWVAAFFADRLGGHVHVTTGFLTSIASVRAIWLTQAGVVVAGHVIAVLLAHALALRAYGHGGKAWRVLAPLSTFMILYTLFGLWLLAAARGA